MAPARLPLLIALPLLTVVVLRAATAVTAERRAGSEVVDRQQWAVKLAGWGSGEGALEGLAEGLAAEFGLVSAGRVEPFERVFLLEEPEGVEVKGRLKRAQEVHTSLSTHPRVMWSSWQRPLRRVKRSFDDEYFHKQWHLVNRMEVGHDINVTWSWAHNITGLGVVVAVIDDGLEHTNPDLRDNYNASGSHDFNGRDADPLPRLSGSVDNAHGTKCGGLIAAVPNDVCGVGVAYGSQVAGIRILDGTVTDLIEGRAFIHQPHVNSIYSCSWGPDDSGSVVEGPGPVAMEALRLGTSRGRYGYGNVYVFASGNGGRVQDNCNYDGYANSIYTLTVGAVEEQNKMPYYAEQCSAILAVTYSNGRNYGDRSIVTTDSTKNGGCTQSFSGTSAAAPIAAGIVALMLQVRPCLSWRDVQCLLVYTAVKVDSEEPGWVRNGAGFHHSNQHGFGLMDSFRLTTVAAVWPLLPNLTEWSSAPHTLRPLPPTGRINGSVSVASSTEVPASVEHVAVAVGLSFPCRGAVHLSLSSPRGTHSILATTRTTDDSADGLSDWTFTSVAFWGEEPEGVWSLSVTTDVSIIPSCVGRRYHGSKLDWRLVLYGSTLSGNDIAERRRVVNAIVSGSCDPALGSCDWSPDPCPPLPSNPPTLNVKTPFFLNTWQLVVVVVIQGLLVYAVFVLGCDWGKRVWQRCQTAPGRGVASSRDQDSSNEQETALLLGAEVEVDLSQLEAADHIETTFILSPPTATNDQSQDSAAAVSMATTQEDERVEAERHETELANSSLQEAGREVLPDPNIVAANDPGT